MHYCKGTLHKYVEINNGWFKCTKCDLIVDLQMSKDQKEYEDIKYEDFLDKSFGTWKKPLSDMLYNKYFKTLGRLPRGNFNVFEAFKACPFEKTKVIVLGQEPYQTKDTPNGIAFGTDQNYTPYALKRIKECLNDEFGDIENFDDSLRALSSEGVLFLNTSLTFPFSPAWNKFIKFVLHVAPTDIVMAWGKQAKSIVSDEYRVFSTGHPSSGFYGVNSFNPLGHFKQVNALLTKDAKTAINWCIQKKSKELGTTTQIETNKLSIVS